MNSSPLVTCCAAWTRMFSISPMDSCLFKAKSQSRAISGPRYMVWAAAWFTPMCWQHFQTSGETVCRHTGSRSGYLVLTDRQQTHQVPVKVHQVAAMEIRSNTDNLYNMENKHSSEHEHSLVWRSQKLVHKDSYVGCLLCSLCGEVIAIMKTVVTNIWLKCYSKFLGLLLLMLYI